jgi:hypothetical protein
MAVGHRLVGNRRDAGRQQILSLRPVGGQMEIGEDDLAGLELLALDGERLLHLDDQLGAVEHLVGVGHDLRARLGVSLVRKLGAGTGTGLYQHAVAPQRKLLHRRRNHTDAVLVVLDLFRNADKHGALLYHSLQTRGVSLGD